LTLKTSILALLTEMESFATFSGLKSKTKTPFWICTPNWPAHRALEQKYKVHFYQWFFWNPLGTTNKCMLPIFEVKWGEGDIPAMEVTILGSTKELMELRMEDDSVSRRPPLIVTNVTELNSDPYPPMKHPQHAVAAQTNSMGLTFDTNTLARPQPIRPESKNE